MGVKPDMYTTFTHGGYATQVPPIVKMNEDVKFMSEIGLEDGRGAINQKGIKYHNNLINELVKHGIQPHATLYHLDLPQVLQDEYGRWLSPKFIDDFLAYANICFQEFGDRISHWTTLNEPNIFTLGSYDQGILPPNRCSYPFGLRNCTSGNSTVEPYIVMHNIVLAHASVVELYRTKYQLLVPGSLPVDPTGLESFLLCLKSKYGSLPIYIHENGFGTPYNAVTFNDTERINAINRYFVWSFLDDENRRRQSKLSALWYREFLKKIQDVMAF
ncbi:unnamed protein product [Spirodela intermedia]|uniref:Uncharacterized protein n=1 Tax=Spirodela intermedia TaxID=51605 RepID=A0A7I8KSB9_SPIIN|nr:unnamed protein product [Spirodela intermedia]